MIKINKKPNYWTKATRHLSDKDDILAKLIESHGHNNFLMRKNSSFRSFFNIIIGQQISIASANAIESRIRKELKRITPKIILETNFKIFRKCGLSHRKSEYLKGIAEKILRNPKYISNLKKLNDETIIEELCKIRGIGKWSAEMFLIFDLNRPNILPLQDIGLINSFCKNYDCERQNFSHQILKYMDLWKPYCTVATWYLWRDIDEDIVQY